MYAPVECALSLTKLTALKTIWQIYSLTMSRDLSASLPIRPDSAKLFYVGTGLWVSSLRKQLGYSLHETEWWRAVPREKGGKSVGIEKWRGMEECAWGRLHRERRQSASHFLKGVCQSQSCPVWFWNSGRTHKPSRNPLSCTLTLQPTSPISLAIQAHMCAAITQQREKKSQPTFPGVPSTTSWS